MAVLSCVIKICYAKTTFYLLLLSSANSFAQSDSTKWLRAFPITAYMVDLDDTTKIVQLEMPEGLIIKDKQPGIIYGVYRTAKDDAVERVMVNVIL